MKVLNKDEIERLRKIYVEIGALGALIDSHVDLFHNDGWSVSDIIEIRNALSRASHLVYRLNMKRIEEEESE